MTDPGEDTTTAARSLDRLGAAAASESPPPPSAASLIDASTHWRSGARRVWLLAGAAVVAIIVALGAGTWAGRDDESVRVAGPDTTGLPAPVAPDVDVEVEFDPPTTTGGMIQASLVNRSDRRLELDCLIWRVDRWDGAAWAPFATSAIWADEGQLQLYDGEMTLDCGETEYLEPGATTYRVLIPEETLRSRSSRSGGGTATDPSALPPGRYRLVVPADPTRGAKSPDPIEADARFEVVPVAEPPPTSASTPDGCELLADAEIADVLGVEVDALAPPTTDPAATALPTGCALEAAPWSVTYETFDVGPSQKGDALLGEPVDLGDEAYVSATTDRSARWSATGFVRVGERGAMVSVGSSATGADGYPPTEGPAVEPMVRDRAVRLLDLLAARL
jgi:hypothetical protein